MQHADGRTHAQIVVHRKQRGSAAQRIASDIPHDADFLSVQRIEEPPVRTSGAHDRRTGRDRILQFLILRDFQPLRLRVADHWDHYLPQKVLAVFPLQREHILSVYLKTHRPAVVLNDGIQFLHDPQLLHAVSEVPDQRGRKRVDQADLQHVDPVAENFLDILVAGGIADHADLPGSFLIRRSESGCRTGYLLSSLRPFNTVQFNAMEHALISKRGQFPGPFLNHRMPAKRVCRRHQIFLRVLLIGFLLLFHTGPCLNDALGVRDTGAHLYDHRRIILLRQFIGCPGETHRFRGIRRFKHRQFGGDCVMARILFILGGMHACIVRDHDDQTGVHSGIGGGIQRICSHVHADMLHGAHAAFSRYHSPSSWYLYWQSQIHHGSSEYCAGTNSATRNAKPRS